MMKRRQSCLTTEPPCMVVQLRGAEGLITAFHTQLQNLKSITVTLPNHYIQMEKNTVKYHLDEFFVCTNGYIFHFL